MKKLLALTVALMLLCLPALAEEAAYASYTHPDLGFSIQYPSAWLAVDKYNVDGYIEQYNAGTMDFSGTNVPTLTNLKAQLEAQNCAMLIDPYSNNLVIAATDIEMELGIELFNSIMVPLLVEEIKNQLPGIEVAEESQLVSLGGKDFVCINAAYSAMGIDIEVMQLYYLEGTMMYALNLTATSAFGVETAQAFATDCINAITTFTAGK